MADSIYERKDFISLTDMIPGAILKYAISALTISSETG